MGARKGNQKRVGVWRESAGLTRVLSLGTATSALTPAAPPSATANSLRKLVLETPNALTRMAPLLRGTTQRSPRQDVNGWEG